MIARALRVAPTAHRYDRVLTAKMTVICVLVACLFPGAGYDAVLATAFGLPGLKRKPGAGIPTGPAFSQARKLLGEQAMKKVFELDAAVPDAELGIGLLWKGLEVTAIDGTTMELNRSDVLDGEFGTPAERAPAAAAGGRASVSFRWIGAAIGGYHDGENALADQLEDSFGPGILNLLHRWIRFSGSQRPPGLAGQERAIRPAQDGEDPARRLRARRPARVGRHAGPGAPRRTGDMSRPGGSRTPWRGWSPSPSPPRPAAAGPRRPGCGSLTTLLDHEAFPAAEIAVLYAERWQIEIAFLHLKRTVRGPRRPLRGQSPDLVRREALGVAAHPQHDRDRSPPARRGIPCGIDPETHPVHRRPQPDPRHRRDALQALREPAIQPLASLNTAILALPRHRQGRQRTSGRTAVERRTRHTEEVTYTINIMKSNLPERDASPKT